MRNILIDAGPIIALFNKRDFFHEQAKQKIQLLDAKLHTTWPVITEASHLLGFSTKAQLNLLEWIRRNGLIVHHIEDSEILRLIQLIAKYDDVPMDLADGSLILLSEKLKVNDILTIDSDFYIYKNVRNKYLNNLFI